jgi:hypothetical protein
MFKFYYQLNLIRPSKNFNQGCNNTLKIVFENSWEDIKLCCKADYNVLALHCGRQQWELPMLTSDQGVLHCSNFATAELQKIATKTLLLHHGEQIKSLGSNSTHHFFIFLCGGGRPIFPRLRKPTGQPRIACYWVIFPMARADAAN